MDGYEVCKKLKANDATRSIPVIFITAQNDDENETFGLELGGVDYITKPIKSSIVQARVKTHLKLKRAYEESVLNKIVADTKNLLTSKNLSVDILIQNKPVIQADTFMVQGQQLLCYSPYLQI